MSLFVPLDVDYASDDKLIEAGPMAELLYVRGLAFAKRTMSDGRIKRSQLAAVAIGIPSAARHAQRLVDTGAWTHTATGWTITAWLRRNKPASQIRAESDAKRAASQLANHKRWHVGKDPSPTCPLCHPTPDATSDPNPETVSESTESEPESETEGSHRESSSSETGVRLALIPPARDDDDLSRVLSLIANAKVAAYHPTNPDGYRATVIRNMPANDIELIRRMLTDGTDPELVALFVLGHGHDAAPHRTSIAIAWCGPDCPDCAGDAWVDTGAGLAPCPNRTTERTAP